MQQPAAYFVGPDDSDTCDGCDEAVTGNPYTIDDVPMPGTFECMSNCRHMVQLDANAPSDIPTVTWSSSLGFVESATTDATTTAAETALRADEKTKFEAEVFFEDALGSDAAYWFVTHLDSEGNLYSTPKELAEKLRGNGLNLDDITPYLNPTTAAEVQQELADLSQGLDNSRTIDASLVSGDYAALLDAISGNPDALAYAKQRASEGFDNDQGTAAMALAEALSTRTGIDWKARLVADTGRWSVQ